jgi:hypothetical protein
MSATDARYEDFSTYDHETKIDHDGNTVVSDGPVLLPVDDSASEKADDSSLPDHDPTAVVDGEEPTYAELVDGQPAGGEVKDVDDDKVKDVDTTDDTSSAAFATDSTGVTTGTTDDTFGTTDDKFATTDETVATTDSTLGTTDKADLKPDGDDVVTDDTAATVGPDTETGALKDPVPDGTFVATDADTSVTPVAAVSETTSTPATNPATLSADWLELQGRFVDDPAAAVKEAGAKVEAALAELRTKIEGGSTEDLRTAFRRYRELHAGLS